MPAMLSFDYATIRVVPRVDREEFVNAGVILFCRERQFLEARVVLDPVRVRGLYAEADLETIERHLAAVPRICLGSPDSGPIGALPIHERFHWLVAPRSTVIQMSPVHAGLCESPSETLARLFESLVGPQTS